MEDKISELDGKDFEISQSKTIKKNEESIVLYGIPSEEQILE